MGEYKEKGSVASIKSPITSASAVKTANAAGAVTIAMTGNMQTGMAKVGQYIVTYSNGDDQVYSDSNQANALRIGFELLKQFENWENYDKAMEAYRYIDEIIEEGKKNVLADAKAWAEKYKDEKNSQLKGWLVFAYVIGSVVLYFVSLFIY